MALSQTGNVEQVRPSAWSAWLPLVILVLGAVATAWSWRALRESGERHMGREIEARTAAVRHEMRARLDDRMKAFGRMAARWERKGRPGEDDWVQEARAHLDDYGGYEAIAWVAPDYAARWIVAPRPDDARLGADLGRDGGRRAAMEKARDERAVRATEAPGDTRVFVFRPLFVADRFDGWLLAVIVPETLLGAMLRPDIAPEFGLEVWTGAGMVFRHGPAFSAEDGGWSRVAEVGLDVLPWEVRVWLPAAARASRTSRYPDAVALGGAWLTILLAIAVSAALRASRRKRALERVHRRVVAAMEDRARVEASLAASELRFRQVVEHMGAVFWQWSLATRTLEYVSPGYEAIWGRSRAELYADPDSWLEHVVPEDRRFAGLDTATDAARDLHDRCYRIVRPDGATRWIRDRCFLFRDGAGTVVAVAGLAEDITEARVAETLLGESEERLRLATDAAHIGIWEWNVVAETVRYSPNMLRLFGLAEEGSEPVSAAVFRNAILDADRARVATAARAVLRGESSDPIELRVVWPDGSVHWVASHSRVHSDAHGRWLRVVGVVRDIDTRKRAEGERDELLAELRNANDMLTRLSRQLLEVQETERRDLARDLHDEIGQCIAAAKINLGLLARRFPEVDAAPPMEDTVALLDYMLRHVSRLCLELRPSMLDDLGLAAAVRWLVQRQAERSGFTARVRTDDLPELGERIQGVCFRTVQEAMTNVMRYASARTVDVTLERGGDGLVLRVADDGVGFDPEARPTRGWAGGGLGLLGMRERVGSVGGELRIDSAPGRGTVVEARIPFAAAEGVPAAAMPVDPHVS